MIWTLKHIYWIKYTLNTGAALYMLGAVILTENQGGIRRTMDNDYDSWIVFFFFK